MEDFSAAGLNATEAKCYATLLSQKQWLPSELAESVEETRTNMYKILDKLVVLGLAEKLTEQKKLRYRATNPSRLLELARQNRAKQQRAEQALELHTQSLLEDYVKVHEQPGVRFFQGEAEIRTIYQEIANSTEEVVFISTIASVDFYGFATMHNYRMLAPNNGVSRRALTVDTQTAPADYQTGDPQVLLQRTWLKHDDYSAPVEWGAFNNKLYIVSYGQDAMGIIIENQPIATAFKQLFALLERGQHLLPDYDKLPRLASQRMVTTPQL